MNAQVILAWSLNIAELCLVLAMALAAFRMLRGPRAQDRVLALDSFYVSGMMLILTFGIEAGETVYFEAALVIALLGFVSTSALAKFLMRGEAIE
jgi:multicomponent K+:H+ antiporter subunit F